MLENKTIVITGATGFIGFHLTRRLLRDNPNLRIVGIDNMNDYYDVTLKEYRQNELSEYKNFWFIRGDISDKNMIMHLFDKYHPHIVINLAA